MEDPSELQCSRPDLMNYSFLVPYPHVRTCVKVQNANFGWGIQEKGESEEGKERSSVAIFRLRGDKYSI